MEPIYGAVFGHLDGGTGEAQEGNPARGHTGSESSLNFIE
jgi:hypothetical protein